MKKLVVFGGLLDPHVKSVATALVDQCAAVYMYDPMYPPQVMIWHGDKDPILRLFNVKRQALEDVDANDCVFWIRNKKKVPEIKTRDDQVRKLMLDEHMAFVDGLIKRLDLPHFNGLAAMAGHRSKIVQHGLALDIGFDVPETLITSNREAAVGFCKEGREYIVKPLHTKWIAAPWKEGGRPVSVLTNEITAADLRQLSDEELAASPMIFQARIPKKFEIRTVAFGEDMVHYRIHTPDSLDWRRANKKNTVELVGVPEAIERAVRQYLKAAGLHYGVFDFAVTPDDDIVFFECNADGQWSGFQRSWLPNPTAVTDMFAANILRMLGKEGVARDAA